MHASKGRMAGLFLISILAILVLASIGFATRGINPAGSTDKITLDSASFHAVMVKLDRLEAEIQKSVRVTEELRRTLLAERRQNAQHFGMLASSSVRPAMFAAAPAPTPPKIVPTKLKLAIELCAKKAATFAGKLGGPKISHEIDIKGSAGADVYGTGAKAEAEIKAGAEIGVEGGGEVAMELTACLSGVEVDIDATDVPNFDLLVNGLVQGWPNTAADMSNFFVNQPLLHTVNLGGTLNLLQNIQIDASPAAFLNGLKSPGNFFANYSGLLQDLPFPGNSGSLLDNPVGLFPTSSDVTFNSFCSGASPGTLLGDTCMKIQNFQNPLDPLANKLDTAEMKIASLQTGVTGYCNTVNNRLTTIRNGSIPARNFSLNLGPVGTFSIPVDVLRTPFSSLSTVSCPVF